MQLAPATRGRRLRRVYSLPELVPVHIHRTKEDCFTIEARSIEWTNRIRKSAKAALRRLFGYTKPFYITARRILFMSIVMPA